MADKKVRIPDRRKPPASRKKMKLATLQGKALPDLPKDVIVYNILTRIPYKALCRLKSVCKDWNWDFFKDDRFTMLRSALAPSASAMVTLNPDRGLVFLDDDMPERRVPCSSLSFIGDKVHVHKILALTNGFLCLYCSVSPNEESFLYLCNPATKEGDRIALPTSTFDYDVEQIVLAFDPSKSPKHYVLVHPHQHVEIRTDLLRCQFKVFSSYRKEWIECLNQAVAGERYYIPWMEKKSVFANGVLYWNCMEYLLWFDYENELSGYMLMPADLSFAKKEIGVCKDRLTCTRMDRTLDVWILVRSQRRSYKWEKVYQVNFDKMMERNIGTLSWFFKTMRPASNLLTIYQVVPLSFESCGERVFFMLTTSGKISDADLETQCLKGELMLRYDINTGKLDEVFKDERPMLFENEQFAFGYCSNMLPVSK